MKFEGYNFVGKNLSEARKKSAISSLENTHKNAVEERNPDYRDPTPEEIVYINTAKRLLEEELILLNVDSKNFDIDIFQFKFLKYGVEQSGYGEYRPDDRIIEINSRVKDKLEKEMIQKSDSARNDFSIGFLLKNILLNIVKKINYETILHEATHAKSFHKREISNNTSVNRSYRTGYNVERARDGKEQYFSGFNEAIVDKTTLDIVLRENKDYSSSKKDISRFLFYLNSGYRAEMMTVDSIIKNVAKHKKESEKEVWDRFKKGQFTGDMMHLRDIEEAYGPGALRILATMDSYSKNSQIKNFLYYFYFSTKSSSIRQTIEERLISEKSKEKLDKHIEIINKNIQE